MNTGIKQHPAPRAGLQRDHGSSVGRGDDPADRKGRAVLPRPPENGAYAPPRRDSNSPRRGRRVPIYGAGATSRRLLQASVFLIWLCLARTATAQLDVFHLRDGTTLTGNIVGETADEYRTLIQTPTAPMMTNVPVRAVRYVVYGTPQKGHTSLDLERIARTLDARDAATVRFLPTEAFGEAVQEAVQSAQSRIWILAYYISGGSHETIQAIYNTVREKTRIGLDALVISEFGKGTPMPIRNATLNYANTLQDDGVKVRFIQEYRTLHKKVILVDRDKVLIGSANLTGVGVSYSDEFSALIVSEPFARKAEADFKRLAQQAQPIEKLDY